MLMPQEIPFRVSAMITNDRSLTSRARNKGDVCLYIRNKETIDPLGIGSRDLPSEQLRRSTELGIVFGCTIYCNVAILDSTEAKNRFFLLHEFHFARRLKLDAAQGTNCPGFLRFAFVPWQIPYLFRRLGASSATGH